VACENHINQSQRAMGKPRDVRALLSD